MTNTPPSVTYTCGCKVTVKSNSSSIIACERHKDDKNFKQALLTSAKNTYRQFQRQKLLGLIKDL